jgi:hypothetical protein
MSEGESSHVLSRSRNSPVDAPVIKSAATWRRGAEDNDEVAVYCGARVR